MANELPSEIQTLIENHINGFNTHNAELFLGVFGDEAIIIGGIETTALIAHKLELTRGGWRIASSLAEHFNALGFAIIGLFAAAWAASYFIYRWKRFDGIEVLSESREL